MVQASGLSCVSSPVTAVSPHTFEINQRCPYRAVVVPDGHSSISLPQKAAPC